MRSAAAGVLLRYQFQDGTGMTFRMSELFSSCQEILAHMIAVHGPATIVEPKPPSPPAKSLALNHQTRLLLVDMAKRLEREQRQGIAA